MTKPEQRVVVGAVDPGVVGQRRAHATATATAMTAIAAGGEVGVMPLLGEGGISDLVGIRIVQPALGRAVDQVGRRGGVVRLAALAGGGRFAP